MAPNLQVEILPYYPPRVTAIIASSFSYFVGRIDDDTVPKYQNEENLDINTLARLNIEAQIYRILSDHDRIIQFKGGDERGICLEYAINGSVAQYLRQTNVALTISQRSKWAQQAAEGMAYIHEMGVLHCDTNANDLLLNRDLNIKFADFEGRYLSPNGTILLNGLSSKNVKSFMPRSDLNYANHKIDIFALRSAIYYMMTGHETFLELNPLDDNDEAEIMARYKSGRFPNLGTPLRGGIVRNC